MFRLKAAVLMPPLALPTRDVISDRSVTGDAPGAGELITAALSSRCTVSLSRSADSCFAKGSNPATLARARACSVVSTGGLGSGFGASLGLGMGSARSCTTGSGSGGTSLTTGGGGGGGGC